MCLCMCCHGWRVFHTVCIFFLALAIASLVVFVGEADYPPICLHSPLAHQDLALRFYFTRCEVRHLGYFISLDYHMCTFRTTSLGVCSVLAGPFFCLMFWSFWRGVRSGQVNLRALSAWPGLENPSWSSWWSLSYIQVASSIWTLLAGSVLVGSSWSRGSLLIKGLRSYRRYCFAIAVDVPGSCFPNYLYHCPH